MNYWQMTMSKEFILMSIKMLVITNYLKDNGIKNLVKEMGLGFNFGKMDLDMKDNGGKIKQTVEVE